MSDHVDFYEVDGGCARELVALADVRNFPVSRLSLSRFCASACWQPASLHSAPRRIGRLSTLLQVTQIYARGALCTTRPINSKVLFEEFNAGLLDLVLEFADFSVARGG